MAYCAVHRKPFEDTVKCPWCEAEPLESNPIPQPFEAPSCKHTKTKKIGIWTDALYRCHAVCKCDSCGQEIHEDLPEPVEAVSTAPHDSGIPEAQRPMNYKGQNEPQSKNIHGEVLPERYRFSPEDELRLESQDFYSHGNHSTPPADVSGADRFMAARWYGQFMSPMHAGELGVHAWRISRERQLTQALTSLAAAQKENERFRVRVYGCKKVVGNCHATYCTIWGDDGQGCTPEGYTQPLPCNCGALLNHIESKLSEALAAKEEAEKNLVICKQTYELNILTLQHNYCIDMDDLRDLMREKCEERDERIAELEAASPPELPSNPKYDHLHIENEWSVCRICAQRKANPVSYETDEASVKAKCPYAKAHQTANGNWFISLDLSQAWSDYFAFESLAWTDAKQRLYKEDTE